MTSAVAILPSQQLAALNEAYRKAVARKRLRFALGAAAFLAALAIAAFGAEVNLRTFFTYIGNFVSYFDRILKLDDGSRVWTNFGEWFWGWQKWLKLLRRDASDQLCRDPDRRGAGVLAEFLRRREYVAGALASLHRSPAA